MLELGEGPAAAGAALAGFEAADPLALEDPAGGEEPAGDEEPAAQPARARPDTATAAAMTQRDRVIMFGSLLRGRSGTRATGSSPALSRHLLRRRIQPVGWNPA